MGMETSDPGVIGGCCVGDKVGVDDGEAVVGGWVGVVGARVGAATAC